jgi:hypothetical protein
MPTKKFITKYCEKHTCDDFRINSVLTFNSPVNRKVTLKITGKKPVNMWADDNNRIDIPYELKLNEDFYLEYDIYVYEDEDE